MSKFKQWFSGRNLVVRGVLILAIVIVLTLTAITVSATTWEYTNSPEFCGTVCHTMPPEYLAYQVSPHARVDCVDCHLGQDSLIETVPRKARELRHVVNALTQAYEPPIYVKSLRPARDTCEKCHNPDKFSSDTFVEIKRYAEDEANTENRNFLIVKTGGGTQREGLGRGIHWHIENEVQFYSGDPLKQDIPYIREVRPDGEVIEYFDVESGLPPDFGQKYEGELHRMDCIDCHTRISHLFRSPADAIDEALARHRIDQNIPEIKKQAVELLTPQYASTDEGLEAIDALDKWYQENYPDFYSGNQAAVQNAIEEIKEAYSTTVFPNMAVGWQTHPNNLGHREFPGCFRCHDGKHTSSEGQTVRLECNICHSIPEIVETGKQAPVIAIDRLDEPDSHLDSNWLARHRYEFDETCAECHDISNPGGTDNSSFCSNSGCHATEWKFVGLAAPAIRDLVEPPRTPGNGEPLPVPHPIAPRTDCNVCHATEAVIPFPEDHTAFDDQRVCTLCHEPTLVDDTGAAAVSVPAVPHPVEGQQDRCLDCHGSEAFHPYPENHADRPTDICLFCHSQVEEIAVPAVPHLIEGQQDKCLDCHGSEAIHPYPETHVDRPTDVCVFCHIRAEEPEAVSTEEKPKRPRIPHSLADEWEDCLSCHSLESIVPFPADDRHEKAELDDCQVCHKPEES
jgi:nitrate/TMAO reductase-like tetraheme cytochrome c subunit